MPPNWSIDRSSYAKFRTPHFARLFRIISHDCQAQACMASPTAHASGMPQPHEAVPEPEAQIALLDQSFESVQHPAPTDAVPNRINVAPETSGASPRTCTLHAHLHVHIARSHASLAVHMAVQMAASLAELFCAKSCRRTAEPQHCSSCHCRRCAPLQHLHTARSHTTHSTLTCFCSS